MTRETKQPNPVKATGFASPAQGYEEKTVDFNALLIKNPPATYCITQGSHDMEGKGIPLGSILVVDRSVRPRSGSIVIIEHDGQFLCREMHIHGRHITFSSSRLAAGSLAAGSLAAGNRAAGNRADKQDIGIPADVEIFGTVKAVVSILP